MPERWTRVVLRHRFAVLLAWAAILVAGLAAAAHLAPLLANSFDVPGSDSRRASELLARDFADRPEGTFTVVFHVRHPADRALQARLRRRVAAAARRAVPGATLGTLHTGGGVVFLDVATAKSLQQAKRYAAPLRAALAGSPRAYVTGEPAVQHDLEPVFAADLRRGEAIAVPLTLVALIALLGPTLAVLIPFLVAACTIAATLGLVYLLARDVAMAAYVRNLVELVGLGLAVDYSLLVVHRYREERTRLEPDDAVVATAATAGRTVLFSGAAVAAGLALLLLEPVPFVRSLGVGGLLIPVVSVAAALTLQPALLSLLGGGPAARRADRGFWRALAVRVQRRPAPFLAAGAAALLALAAPALRLHVTPGSLAGVPASTESVQGYRLLRDGLGAGVVTPTHVVIVPAAPAAEARLVRALNRDAEVLLVASGRRPPYAAGAARQVIVGARHDWGEAASRRLVERLRSRLVPAARFPAGTVVMAGGAPPQGVDFVDRLYGAFPWVVAAVLALTFVVLAAAFRSLLLPLKAVVLNLMSVGAAYGALALLFARPVEAWIPVFLFAALFGLSMDYEVFIVSRMREAHDAGASDVEAVARGLESTGPIVTAAAAVMVAAFAGFAAGRIEGLRQFGVGLAIAIALDATVVRCLLVPSLMTVLGRWNWWLPSPRRG